MNYDVYMFIVRSKEVSVSSPPPFSSLSLLHVTNDDSFCVKNQMNQMITKYCQHKSDIVVVFETVITSLQPPAQGPAQW